MQSILEELAFSVAEFSEFFYFVFLFASLIAGIFVLIRAGDALSVSSANFATSLGVPHILIGLTVVSIATSAPELFTSFSAIANDATGLILGNILGSNIANIGLILGITALSKPIIIRDSIPSFQKLTLLLLTTAFSVFIFLSPQNAISWELGIGLLVFTIAYTGCLSYQALKYRRQRTAKIADNDTGNTRSSSWLSLLVIVLSGLGLWIGSEILVFGSKNLASGLGLPEELIGFSIVAVGTSLPELAASLALLKNSQVAMLFGNIIGSNVFNIGLVGGVAGLITPIKSDVAHPWIDHGSMLLLTLLLCWFSGKKELGKTHGTILMLAYFASTFLTWTLNA